MAGCQRPRLLIYWCRRPPWSAESVRESDPKDMASQCTKDRVGSFRAAVEDVLRWATPAQAWITARVPRRLRRLLERAVPILEWATSTGAFVIDAASLLV